MDVDHIVSARRRQQVLDALEFERDRERAIAEQLGEVLTELEGSRIDEAVFAHMAPEDVVLVRQVLEPGDDEDEADLERLRSSEARAEIPAEQQAERLRLETVMADSRTRQQALERYIEALDAGRKSLGGEPAPRQTSPQD